MEDRRERAYQEAVQIVAEAKRLSLSGWFEQQGQGDLKLERDRHYSCWCPNCGDSSKGNKKVFITDDSSFACWACAARGSILDAEMLRYGGTLVEAAKRLLGVDGASRPMPIAPRHQHDAAERARAAEKERARNELVGKIVRQICIETKDLRDSAVLDYLTGRQPGQRGLPRDLVEKAIERNIIRTLPSNPAIASAMIRSIVPESQLREAGLWKEGKENPWIVYRPLWSIAPGAAAAELRITRPPRSKDEQKSIGIGPNVRPYYWEGQNPKGCAVVEGSLDMLAMVALGYEGDIIGLKGVNTWDIEWFVKLQAARGTKRFDTAFDNDDGAKKNSGQLAAMALGQVLVQRGLGWNNVVPPSGDINDLWLTKVGNT